MSDDNTPKNLIGREQEMNDLLRALAGTRAEDPVGQIAFVEGVGGLGKSALVESFEYHLLIEEILYRKIELKNQDAPQNDQYRLIRELFDEMFLPEKKSLARAEIWNGVLKEIGNLASVVPILSGPLMALISPLNRAFAAYIDKEKQRRELPLEASKTNAARLAQAAKIMRTALKREQFRPTVLIADNFHMVDMESAYLLLGLSGALGKMPFMHVCTYRPDELERRTALRDLVHREFPALEAEGGMAIKTIPLGYLGPDNIAEFFQARYPPVDPPSQKTCLILHEKTGGNPLILQEALAYLHNMGVLGDDVRSVDMLRQINADLSGKGKHIIGLRIDHLQKESKDAYRIHTRSSVAGEEFSAEIAGSLTDMDQIYVMETLDEAIDTYRLVQRKEEEMLYRFRHALIHEDFFKRATKDEQLSKMLHRKAAKALELVSESNHAVYNPVRIAELYLGAKEPEQAIKHLQKAMQAAARAQAYHELAHLIGLLLSAMDEANIGTDKERFDLLLTLGRTYELLGSKVHAVDALNKAVQIAENMDEKVLLATALTYCSISQFHAGEHHKSSETANRALDLFRLLADTLTGEDLHTYGICLDWVGENHRSNFELDKALDLHQEACDVARRCGSKRLEAHAKANIGAVHMWKRDYAAVLPQWQEALRLCAVPGEEDWPWVAHYTIDLALPLFLSRDYDNAMKQITKGLDIAEANFFYDNIARGRMNKGSILFACSIESNSSDERMSLLKEALTTYERALPVAKAHGVARLEWRIIHNMGNIHRANGELNAAEELYEQAAQYIERMREGEPNKEGFMQHRFRPFLSLMLLAQQNGRCNEEIVAIANRSYNDYAIAFAKDLIAGEFDDKAEAERDKNFFSGYYIETE